MRTKALIAVLTLALLSGLTYAGEPGGPRRSDRSRDERDIGPRSPRDGRDFGPRHRGWHRGPGPFGHRGPGFGPGPMHGFPMPLLERINLTEAQQKQYVDIMTDNYRAGLELRLAMHATMGTMRDQMKNGSPSEDAIISINREMGELRGKMQALAFGLKDKLNAILTPEQKQIADDFRPARPPRDFDGRRPGRGSDMRGPRDFGPRGPGHHGRDFGGRHMRGWDDDADVDADDDSYDDADDDTL